MKFNSHYLHSSLPQSLREFELKDLSKFYKYPATKSIIFLFLLIGCSSLTANLILFWVYLGARTCEPFFVSRTRVGY